MSLRLWNGAIAGLAGGVIFGAMMHLMRAPTPEGGSVPVMQMVAMVVRSENLAVGWLYHLFNSALLGAAFGVIFGSRVCRGIRVVWATERSGVWCGGCSAGSF